MSHESTDPASVGPVADPDAYLGDSGPDDSGPVDSGPDEWWLVTRAQDGDVDAFGQLVDIYSPRLFRFAMRLLYNRADAEDAVQDAALQAFRKLPDLADPDAFSAWIYRIVKNRCAEIQRTAARRATDPWDPQEMPEGHASELQPSVRAEQHGAMAELEQLVRRMSDDLRVCWVLAELEEMSYAEIAEIVGVTRSTVRGRIARARAQLAKGMVQWQ